MSNDYWDGRSVGLGPNLAKLPLDVRRNLTVPIPLREGEVYGRVVVFRKSPSLVHPNGRINVTAHQSDPMAGDTEPTGIQIDTTDFSARVPISTFVLAKDAVPGVLTNLLRAYMQLGATEDEILSCLAAARKAPKISLSAVVNYEEQASNE